MSSPISALRVLTYNVRGFRHGRDRILRALEGLEPDVALLQECGTERGMRRFARGIGMEAVAGSLTMPWRRVARNAVLTRPPWVVTSYEPIAFTPAGGVYPRGAVVAAISSDAGKGAAGLRVVSLHLGLADGERVRHARELLQLVDPSDGPIVIGGDLNEVTGGAIDQLTGRFSDAFGAQQPGGFTYPAQEPVARIDRVFVSEGIEVTGARVVDSPEARVASDHLPLVADLSLGA